MKWTNDIKDQLTKLAFEEKSNKEISEIMDIPISKINEGRSRFGITVAKVNTAKEHGQVAKTKEVIQEEINKVKDSKFKAYKKIAKYDEMLKVLEKELFNETLLEFARN